MHARAPWQRRLALWLQRLVPVALAVAAAGCETFPTPDWYLAMQRPRVELPPPQGETVLQAGLWVSEQPPEPGTLAGDCVSAKILFQRGEYEQAEKVFRWLASKAEKEKNLEVLEESLYCQGECLYHLRRYPKAMETFTKLLKVNPSTRYRGEAVSREFEMAEYWLKDTREAMREWREFQDGERWVVMPRLVSFETEMPWFDAENHTLKAFETIYTQDPSGPEADRALYLAGGINYFRERYQEADTFYSLLVENYPRSPLAPQALELAIQSKINQIGGADYDGRKLVEARQMVDTAMRGFPELREKAEFLQRTLFNIQEQQAAKDFATAEFYRRTHHPGAAYFYYEIVRRRYAGTPWADKALERIYEIRGAVEVEASQPQE
ncbi:MAG TPA: tetratricopeptide repeat protein [Gemmatales bacterium]|nr:tetratricopeptide repeat protein [Gemmatales bacterium]